MKPELKLRMLDLYCCQGGAGMGYHLAGWDVVGVDVNPQPRCPFAFHQGDALGVLAALYRGEAVSFVHRDGTVEWLRLDDFDAVHASPPCQLDSRTWKINKRDHPDLIAKTRDRLVVIALPYVIENVEEARPKLINPIMLCGAMFPGLHTYRHRLIETSFPLLVQPEPRHLYPLVKMGRPLREGDWYHAVGNFSNVPYVRADLDVPWMSRDGIRECVPPVYTSLIGEQLLAHIASERAA